MFEFYLWLMVTDGPQHHWEPMPFTEDENEFWREDAWLEAAPRRLREKIGGACEEVGMPMDLLALRTTHGGVIATVGFARNHPLAKGTERRFLEAIAARAPTSYGVIYTLDTSKPEPRGEFNVFKLANGQVVETVDMLVKPAG